MAYREEVLGRRVEILFVLPEGESVFYQGTIERVELMYDDDKKIQSKHLVIFDDGDEEQFDLTVEEGAKRLHWIGKDEQGSAYQEVKRKAAINHALIMTVKQQSTDEKGSDSGTRAASKKRKGNDQKVKPSKTSGAKRSNVILKTEDPAGNESDDGSNDFLDEQNQEHFNIEDVPESIDGIIRYMDEQDPGNSYYERQQDNRGGCSKTRKKLRDYARANPEDPAVVHWVNTKKWQPPTAESLKAMMHLLKSMIK